VLRLVDEKRESRVAQHCKEHYKNVNGFRTKIFVASSVGGGGRSTEREGGGGGGRGGRKEKEMKREVSKTCS